VRAGTPLLAAPELSRRTDCDVFLQVEGANPTGFVQGPRDDGGYLQGGRGGAQAVICASTGNTSASAAAYAVRARMTCAVLVRKARSHWARWPRRLSTGLACCSRGNFDDCLELARKLAVDYPVALVNSVNPFRLEGQKTRRSRSVDVLGPRA